ncbi:MAG: carboxypeptidase-like regulatory domain-containing protein [Firmicutes bacterium]|nr:carboxypeptidase-like regulatory domain-containing protein [Bacillota bacterium]MDH7495345.1 carboxypeptidase-like regulatory domain-containing protein [Bacillota bacterium]
MNRDVGGARSAARRAVGSCVLLALCCLVSVGATGCFGGGGVAAPSGSVVGYVSEIDVSDPLKMEVTFFASSPGVQDAQATLVGTNKTAKTSPVGKFSFTSVSPGTYDMLVQKTGWPSVRVYGIKIEANSATEVGLRMGRRPNAEVTQGRLVENVPPSVTIDCPSTVSGTVEVAVTPSDASGVFGVALFVDQGLECVWGFGNEAGEAEIVSGETLVWEWSTVTGFPGEETGWNNGEHRLMAMVVDTNYNIAYRTVTVTVDNSTSQGTVPVAPSELRCGMSTVHYSCFQFPWGPSDLSDGSDGEPLALATTARKVREFGAKSGSSVRGTPSGSDAVVFANIYWRYENPTGVMGYKVYRNGRFVVDIKREWGDGWMDGSPVLTPGQRVEYAVSAYNRVGEGPKSPTVARTPIAPLTKVVLTGPADGEEVDGATPAFRWERVSGAEAYLVFVSSTGGDATLMWIGYARGADSTSVTYGSAANSFQGAPPAQELVPGETYAWGVMALSLEPNLPGSDPLDLSAGYEPETMSMSASDVQTFSVTTDAL